MILLCIPRVQGYLLVSDCRNELKHPGAPWSIQGAAVSRAQSPPPNNMEGVRAGLCLAGNK